MTTALVISCVWLCLAWVVAILVGRAVRLRDERERPTVEGLLRKEQP